MPEAIRSSGAVVLLAAFTLLLIACSETRQVEKVVFQSNRDGNFEIYTMNADGTNQQRLTTTPANDVNPSWSPDGSTILFASDRDGNWEIYLMDTDGKNPRRLTNGEGANTAPSWAMKGQKILFVSTRDVVNGEVYMMDTAGQNVERITHDPSVKDSPVMTPDGSRILMTINDKGRYHIGGFSRSGGEITFLTSLEHNSLYPQLSPDGAQVIFMSDRDGNFELYSMLPTGARQVRLTTNTYDDRTPAWTSSTKEILYSKRGSIYRLSLETHNEIMLSNSGDSYPRWFGD